jgi:hypothetical protein
MEGKANHSITFNAEIDIDGPLLPLPHMSSWYGA